MSAPGVEKRPFDEDGALSERLAQVLWLIAMDLLDWNGGDARRQDRSVIARRMSRLLRVDEDTAARAWARLQPRFERSPWSALDVAEALAGELFTVVGGRATLRGSGIARRLLAVIDPSALAPFCPELTCNQGEPLEWLPVSATQSGREWDALGGGSVDTHVHLAGCVPPAFFWVALMGGGAPFVLAGALSDEAGGQAPRDVWIAALARAAWLRCWLAARLREAADTVDLPFARLPRPGHDAWKPFARDELPPRSPLVVRKVIARLAAAVKPAVAAGWAGRDDDRVTPWGRAAAYPDPLRDGEAWGVTTVNPLAGERRLLYLLAALLRQWRAGRADALHPELAPRVLKYLRVRNAFYQATTYTAESQGLRRFSESLKRQAFLASGPRKRWVRRRQRLGREYLRFEHWRMLVALRAQLREPFRGDLGEPSLRPVRAIEMRVSLRAGGGLPRVLQAWLDGIEQYLDEGSVSAPSGESAADDTARHQVGLIVHFHKQPDRQGRCGVNDARVLTGLLASCPGLRRFIVGVDVAGSERSAVPRACARAFAEIDYMKRRFLPRYGEPAVRLGLTYHAGEDPWDMLSGLRHIDEAATLLFGDARSRIGHGLVLADDPAAFYLRRRGSTEPDLSTHLLDLVWAWGRCREAGLVQEHLAIEGRIGAIDADLRAQADAPIGRVSPRGTPMSVRVEGCWQAMWTRRALDDGRWDVEQERDLVEVLGFPSVSARARLIVPEPDWLAWLRRLQELVRHRLAHRGIAVEVNPTSNLNIGRYSDYTDLPYDALVESGVQVSINTDNPGFMATNLPLEFQRLYNARLCSGTTHRRVVEWLSARAEDARQSTFIGAQTPVGRVAAKLIRSGRVLSYRRRLSGLR